MLLYFLLFYLQFVKFSLVLIRAKISIVYRKRGGTMGPLIATDIMLLIFSVYIGIFFRYFYSSYPEMKVGFHLWEVCYDKNTWEYGNKFAGRLAIILGIILFGIIYPILLYLELKRSYMTILILLFTIVYFLLLFFIVKIRMRKKFNLKDN